LMGDLLARGNPSSRVVVGLGNAERQYARSRHNVGARAVAAAIERLGLRPMPGLVPVPLSRSGFVLPSGFMNDSGGPGGHNGLRDIMARLGSGAYQRLRIGIGRPPDYQDAADYVLSTFRPEEREPI